MAQINIGNYQRSPGRQKFNPMEDEIDSAPKVAEVDTPENAIGSSSETEVGANAGDEGFMAKFAGALGGKKKEGKEDKKKMSRGLKKAFASISL